MKRILILASLLISVSALAVPKDEPHYGGTFIHNQPPPGSQPHQAQPGMGGDFSSLFSGTDYSAMTRNSMNNTQVFTNQLNASQQIIQSYAQTTTGRDEIQALAQPVHRAAVQDVNDTIQRLRDARHRDNPVPLSSIPDTPETELPYAFESREGDFKSELVRQYQDLYKAPHAGYKRENARAFGLSVTQFADHCHAVGSEFDANFYKELGKEFLNIVVGLDPITGFARSSFEFFTGRNMITGVNLTETERSFAFLGVASFGASGVASRAFSNLSHLRTGMDHIYHGASYFLKARQAGQIAQFKDAMDRGSHAAQSYQRLLSRSAVRNRLTQIHDSNWINRATNNAFKPNAHVIEGKVTNMHGFNLKQVVQEGVEETPFMMRESQIRGLDPSALKTKLGLPESAQIKVNDVRIPEGTGFLRGESPQGVPGYYIKNMRNEYVVQSPEVFH